MGEKTMKRLGIIGGSGLYEWPGLEKAEWRRVLTPFGAPSDEFLCGEWRGCSVVFLPRHGRGHRLLPSEIPHRANIFGLKMLDVGAVVSVSAVGSLREEMRPRDVVLPDQYFDRTKASAAHTFFGNGVAAHVAFGEPTCPALRRRLAAVLRRLLETDSEGRRFFDRGVYVNMEGPAFSTRAESETYRRLGFDVIGMTSLAEAKLCREAEICYQPLAMVTDYDCWHTSAEAVTVEMVIANVSANAALARSVLMRFIETWMEQPPSEDECGCARALENALITDRACIPPEWRKRMAPITRRLLGS